jgi:DNA-binding transcriptional regulator YiaG
MDGADRLTGTASQESKSLTSPSASNTAALDFLQAARMRGVRESAGLSRAAVAEALGWKPARLAQLECGSREPTLEEGLALTRLYALEGLQMIEQLRRGGRSSTRRR